MMGYGGGGFVWLIVAGALVVIPFWRLLPRFGLPAPLALIAIIPLAALILLWIMAFRDDVPPRDGKGTR